MQTTNDSLFSARLLAGRTTYFVDVRQAVNSRFYVSITESRRLDDCQFNQNRIFLFEENLEDMGDILSKAFSRLHSAASERGPLPRDGNGEDGPRERSGKSWTEEEEATLRRLQDENVPIEKMADTLRRSPYAVTLRLEKLNLIEGTGTGKAEDKK